MLTRVQSVIPRLGRRLLRYNRPYSSPAVTAAKTQFSHSPSYNRPYSSPAVTAAKTQFSHSPSYSRPYSSPAVTTPAVDNEKVLTFERGSKERENVVKALTDLQDSGPVDIPCVIGGKEIYTNNIRKQLAPYDHNRVVANFHCASRELIEDAIQAALEARHEWEQTPFEQKAAIYLKIADLMSTKYRPDILATTMVGQGKTVHQAEIDAACEAIDFLRFAVHYAAELHRVQPLHNSSGVWNRLEYRGLEGFIASISPFNFTAIGTNLSSTPALMGNVTLWKPASTAVLSNWTAFKIYREAGMPDGVINFLPSKGADFGDTITASRHLAAINFTGSGNTFNHLWKQVGDNIDNYRTYPRLVGECGGKNYHLVHPTAKDDLESVAYCTVRGAFEYSGQKCSATARMYVPESLWPELRDRMVDIVKEMKVGSPEEFDTFTTAVIDAGSFDNICNYLDFAHASSEVNILVGGNADGSVGYYVDPTIVETTNPKNKLMEEEIFGPILTVYVYPDNDWEGTLKLVNDTSPFALTGSIFARDRSVIVEALQILRQSAGNFYVNDKGTGSVVGQQPFGGARLSGTNDKAGSSSYLQRWASPLAIKEAFVPTTDWRYPSMEQ